MAHLHQHADRQDNPQYTAPRLVLSLTDFVLLRRLGDGSFSTVVLAEHRGSGRQYALKIVEKQLVLKHNVAHHVQRERRILDSINHPGIVRLHFTFQDTQHIYFGLEPLINGELYAQIQQGHPMPLPALKTYTAQMVAMLQRLRIAGVVHRDFKPENLLINPRGHLVLVDFGSARWLHGDGSTAPLEGGPRDMASGAPHDASFVGTAEYTAPETLAGHPPTPAVDLWALGCVVYQMLTGTPPFKGPTEFATFERISNGEFALPSDVDAMYKDAVDLIKQLLVADAGTRLGSDSMAALQAHPLFTGIDWGVDGSALWEGEPVEFVPPRPSSPTAEASDWELLSLQSLAEALPIPRYEYEPNPAFFAGQNESSSTEEE